MESEVNTIRESTRSLLKMKRICHRDELINRECLSSVNSQSIQEIANKLKTKAPVTAEELRMLKNGLMERSEYTDIVLNTHGALRGIVREFTGSDARKQLAAAGCLCNLSLGDSKSCTAVAKAAGVYLVAELNSLSTELAMISAWTVGNLSGSCGRVGGLLCTQGAGARLCVLTQDGRGDVRDAAVYALSHLAAQMNCDFKVEYLTRILENLSQFEITTESYRLIFILTCHSQFQVLPSKLFDKILQELPQSFNIHLSSCTSTCSFECKLLYLVRILANLHMNDTIYGTIMDNLLPMIPYFNNILQKDDLVTHSVLWLVGNLYNYNSEHLFFYKLL